MQHLRILFAVLLAATLVWTPASAQLSSVTHSTGVDSARSDRFAWTDPPRPRTDMKSPGRATLYSTGGTLLLAPVFGSGLIVGPSFGHFYAHNSQQAVTCIALRTAGATALLVGVENSWGHNGSGGAEALSVIGLVTVVGSAVYDIGTADDAARAYNEDQDRTARLVPTSDGNDQVGLALRVTL